MSASLSMVLSTFLFATMAVCVKLATAHYDTGEIVFYRGLTGAITLGAITLWRGGSMRTSVPGMHFWRGLSGVCSLAMWFYAIGNLPLATAMTLNYMSSVWMSLFLIGGAAVLGSARVDGRLVATVLVGFIGVALILRPTVAQDQLWHGLIGLLSGILSATAYLQVSALGRAGEPDYRIVFYFSIGGMTAGALSMLFNGMHGHTWTGAALLLGVGLLATAAQLLMTRAYGIGKPLVNASLQYLGIAYSFGYGILLFNDRVSLMGLLGIVFVIGAGLAATLLRTKNAPETVNTTTNEG